MAVEREHPDGSVEVRRTREAYIATLMGQPYRLTLYRDHLWKAPGSDRFVGGRDDKPINVDGAQVAALQVEDQNGEIKSGDYAMDLVARVFDLIDETYGVSVLSQSEPEPEPETDPEEDQEEVGDGGESGDDPQE